MSEYCNVDVPDGGRSVGFHKCIRKATKDGYCWQHHPDAVKKREQESQERFTREMENSPWRRLDKLQQKYDRLVEAGNTLVDEVEYDRRHENLSSDAQQAAAAWRKAVKDD